MSEYLMRYARAHVLLHARDPQAFVSCPAEVVDDVFAILPPPPVSFDQWLAAKGLKVHTEQDDIADNVRALAAMGVCVDG